MGGKAELAALSQCGFDIPGKRFLRFISVRTPHGRVVNFLLTHNPRRLARAASYTTMKRFLLLLSLCFVAASTTVFGQALTQQDVLKLLELKIPEQTIIDKVKDSGTAFVLGTEDIARLKKAGASEALVSAMQSNNPAAGAGASTAEITDLALIVDYSGSMNAKMKDGATKVASAKRCVTDLIDKLPDDLNIALIVYGTSKARGCQDIDVVQPLGPISKASLKTNIEKYKASGMTPIASSLTKAGEELKKAKGGSAIVLVTDGAESCHGDPAAVAAQLAAEFGTKFGINVIGFGIAPKEKSELADIAAKGHGKLVTVENASELAGALQKVVAEKVAAPPPQRETKKYEAAGAAAKPGSFLGDAPTVQPGDYKGELAMKEAKYYSVGLNKGQELRAIAIVKKTPYQAMNQVVNQTFSLTIYDQNLNRVAHEKMDVKDNPTTPVSFRATWTADRDGPAYIAVAASDNHDTGDAPVELYKNLNPDPSPYTLKIKVEGAGPGETASTSSLSRVEKTGGNGLDSAAELKPPALASSDLKLGETAFFKFPVKKGDPVQVAAAVQKPWYNADNKVIQATYTLTLYDDDQVQVAQKKIEVPMNPPEAETVALDWPAAMSGSVYLSVAGANSGQDIYPAKFEPTPGRLCVLATTGNVTATTAGSESATSPSAPVPGQSSASGPPSPSPQASKVDAFRGAESTPH